MRSETALIPEGPYGAVADSHPCPSQLIVCCVNVHPHDELACLAVVDDFGALKDHGGVSVRVGTPLQSQSCKSGHKLLTTHSVTLTCQDAHKCCKPQEWQRQATRLPHEVLKADAIMAAASLKTQLFDNNQVQPCVTQLFVYKYKSVSISG